jgi:chromosome segregation ATPase
MDIVERLREEIGGYTDVHLENAEANMKEAADEIERLRRRVEVLEMDYSHSIKEGIDLGKGWKEACDEIEQLREDLKDQKGKTIAAYKREAKWIENISTAKIDIERLREALEIISDKLYDKGEYDLWAAARNALWQGGKV